MPHPGQSESSPPGPSPSVDRALVAVVQRLVHLPSPRPWLGYVVALLATVLAALLRWWLGLLVGPELHPFILFYPVVLLAALLGGTGPGLFSTALAAVIVSFVFLPPYDSLAASQPADQLGLALFIAINTSLTLVCGALRTARHRTFAEARRAATAEARFTLFMDHSPALVWVKDDQGRYTYLNKAYEQRFGRSLAESLGKTDADLWPADVAARLQKTDWDVLAAGHPLELTEEVTEPNGTHSLWLNTKFPVRDAAGGRFIATIGLDITEHKRAEEELRVSQQRFTAFMRHLPGAAWIKDLAGCYVYANPEAERIFGTPAPELLGKADDQIFPPETARQFRQNDQRALAKAGHIQSIETLRQPDGLDHYSIVSKFAVPGFNGQPAYIGGVAFDVTERIRAEEALRKREAILRSVISTETVGILFFALSGRITDVNPALLRMSGYTREELLAISDWKLLTPPEFQDVTRSLTERIATTGQTTPYEKQWIRKDGSRFWGLFAPTRLEGTGMDSLCIEFIIDITDRKRAEEALRSNEARLAQAVRVARLGTFEHDHLTDRITLSESLRDILGFSPDQTVTLPAILERVPPEFRSDLSAAIASAHDPAGNGLLEIEHLVLVPGREPRWLSTRSQTFFSGRGSDGRPVRTFGAVLDVTDQKEHAAALARLVQERTALLRETVAELEHFSYTITHDMRAPLRAMTGYTHILTETEAAALSAQGRDLLRRVSESALRMDQLITDALQYSSVVRQEVQLRPLQPAPALHGLVEAYPQFQPPHARITIQSEMPPVLANDAAFTQVFSNLIGNAVKFVAPGRIPEIAISAEPRGDFVRLWVKDNGIGIPPEYQPKVWQMFQRLSKQYEGTGIGLALVRKVVERMGGQVGVESAAGQGSCFWVELRHASAPTRPPAGALPANPA